VSSEERRIGFPWLPPLVERSRRSKRCNVVSGGQHLAIAMAGGYARGIEDSVDIHLTAVRTAAELLASG
jgi:hypothetical protein